LEQIERGEYRVYEAEVLEELLGEVKTEGRKRLAARRKQCKE
jgi:hypothetical protein